MNERLSISTRPRWAAYVAGKSVVVTSMLNFSRVWISRDLEARVGTESLSIGLDCGASRGAAYDGI
jgi:hypothetical protein